MATPKKISELTLKPTINNDDKFVIVDSVAGDNKSVKFSTIASAVGGGGGGGSNILIYDLSQFIANAGVVYPAGTIIRYRNGSGFITGAYKLADGVSALSALQWRTDNRDIYNGIQVVSPDLVSQVVEARSAQLSGRVLTSYINRAGLTNATNSNILLPQMLLVDYPINITRVTIRIGTFTSAFNAMVGFYVLNNNSTYSGTLVSGSVNTINITGTGYWHFNYSPPLFLDAGIYYIVEWFAPGGGWSYINDSANHGGLLNSSDVPTMRLNTISWTTSGSMPATINSGLVASALAKLLYYITFNTY